MIIYSNVVQSIYSDGLVYRNIYFLLSRTSHKSHQQERKRKYHRVTTSIMNYYEFPIDFFVYFLWKMNFSIIHLMCTVSIHPHPCTSSLNNLELSTSFRLMPLSYWKNKNHGFYIIPHSKYSNYSFDLICRALV